MNRPNRPDLSKSIIYQIFLRTFTLDGTLKSAEMMLPHIASLGVDIVYLCPIAEADGDERPEFWSDRQKQSNLNNPKNPYRISDYYKIDPEYGTDADLRDFIRSAHQSGMRVLLDLVYFHCGPSAVFLEAHPDFVQRDEAGNIVNGNWHFPQLDFNSAELREYLWQNMEYFVREFDVDGYRCDVSFGVPLAFWEEGRRRMELLKPEVIMIAESEREPANDQRFAFDVNYSFSFVLGLNSILKNESTVEKLWEEWDKRPHNTDPVLLMLRGFDNHDVASDNYSDRPEKRGRNKRVDAALAVTFTMNGIPFLYNGQEVLDGRRHSLWNNRDFGKNMVIDWSRGLTPDGEARMRHIRELAALRQNHKALICGEVVRINNDHPESVISYLRQCPEESIFIAANLGSAEVTPKFEGITFSVSLAPGEWAIRDASGFSSLPGQL